ncbi:MAG: glutathione peroxidase [Bdellovibrionota bacterium]
MSVIKFTILSFALTICLVSASFAGSFYDLSATTADGKSTDFSAYGGKVILVTNVAIKCGFSSQLSGLEELYQKYKDKNFIVLAFPSADLSPNEPTNNEGVHKFCSLQHGVSFPVFEYRKVKGKGMCPIFGYLTKQCDKEHAGDVGSNFEKFLIDKTGKVRARYGPFTGPMSMRLTDKIEELLAEKNDEPKAGL